MQTDLTKLTFQTLGAMDNKRIATAVELALRRCEVDCRDAPGLKEARKVALLIELTPIVDVDSGELDSITVRCAVKDLRPTRHSKAYSMKADAGQGLFFNEFSPSDPRQGVIPDLNTKAG